MAMAMAQKCFTENARLQDRLHHTL